MRRPTPGSVAALVLLPALALASGCSDSNEELLIDGEATAVQRQFADAPTPTRAPATARPTTTPAPPTATRTATAAPTAAPTPTPAAIATGDGCDPAYPGVCIPPPPPDLDCKDITFRRFKVLAPDPHNFDSDHDGVGCESTR